MFPAAVIKSIEGYKVIKVTGGNQEQRAQKLYEIFGDTQYLTAEGENLIYGYQKISDPSSTQVVEPCQLENNVTFHDNGYWVMLAPEEDHSHYGPAR